MAELDPNVLNPYLLLDVGIAPAVSLAFSAASVFLALFISRYFFQSYRFSGFGYLLGLPAGFVFLASSFGLEQLGLMYSQNVLLHPAFYWLQIAFQSEALALIALSYYYKDSDGRPVRIRLPDIGMMVLPLAMVMVPMLLATSELASKSYISYPSLADLGLVMRIFNMAVLAYIFKNTVVSLVRSANVKMLYVPAAFALLWLEQYSLVMTYFDNSAFAFAGSLVARVGGLALFAYVLHAVTSKRRLEIEAREKA